jgi:hypothetical protein
MFLQRVVRESRPSPNNAHMNGRLWEEIEVIAITNAHLRPVSCCNPDFAFVSHLKLNRIVLDMLMIVWPNLLLDQIEKRN